MICSKVSLLFVDDEISILEGLSQHINWEQYGIDTVYTAANGKDALALVREVRPDIIITDINMPVMTGLELIEKLSEEALGDKFVVVSGYDDFKYAQKALQFGVKNYLLKPVNPQKLIDAVVKVVDEIYNERKEKNNTNKNLRLDVQKSKALKEKTLKLLVEGHFQSNEAIENAFAEMGINIDYGRYYCIVFEVAQSYQLSNSTFKEKDGKLVQYLIQNVVEEMLNQETCFVFDYESKKVVAIISENNCKCSNRTNLYLFCEEAANILENISGVPIQIGINSKSYAFNNIHKAFDCAIESLKYYFYKYKDPYIDYSILKAEIENSQRNVRYPYDIEEMVIQSINLKEQISITEALDKFYKNVFFVEFPPPEYVRGVSVQLMNNVIKRFRHYLQTGTETILTQSFLEKYPYLSFEKTKESIYDICFKLAKQIASYEAENSKSIADMSCDFVKKNLMNNITLEEAARNVNLSPTYFSTIFSKEMGKTFRQFVLEVKMEEGKKLLRDKNRSIDEVSQMLAYEDYRSFNRAFKGVVGVSPSQYKKDRNL